jgi:hypothetical protein
MGGKRKQSFRWKGTFMDIEEKVAAGIKTALASLGLTGKPAPPAAPTTETHAPAAPAAPVAPAEDHPVLKAALAAGVDTVEKFNQLNAEAKAGREALPGARQDAEQAAVAYYGTNAEGLSAAKALIAAEGSISQLNALTERFWAGAPGSDRPNQRLSQPTAPTPQKQRENAAAGSAGGSGGNAANPVDGALDKAKTNIGGGHDYYAAYNAPAGARA